METGGKFVRGLGLFDASNLVIGVMIGSGIFIVSADIARSVDNPLLFLLVWVVTGVMTVIAALSYGELGAMFPQAGGQYIYLKEAYNPLSGFLYGWTLFLIIQTGSIAAVGVAFAKFLGVILPLVSDGNVVIELNGNIPFFSSLALRGITTQQLVAIGVIALLTLNNCIGLHAGKLIQNLFTVIKILTLLLITILGIVFIRKEGVLLGGEIAAPVQVDFMTAVAAMGVAMVGSLFAADAWNNITFTAEEVRKPERTIPLSLLIGTGAVITLYILCNIAYFGVLSFDGIKSAPEDRVATAMMQEIFGGSGAAIMAACIMISTFGCLNGMILAGARLYYAMAKDNLFFKGVGRLGSRSNVPVAGLVVQGIWSAALTLSGTYGDLLDYVIFAALLFYALTVIGLFILRWKRPDIERPYKTWGYPVVPFLYVVLCFVIMIILLVKKPLYTWPGLALMLTGVPVYLFWKR